MASIHFLNVNDGDCSIIQHNSGRVSVIDVCNAGPTQYLVEAVSKVAAATEKAVLGNFNQKAYPVNPISYLKEQGISDVHRLIVTHPDMDHIDGIEAFFSEFHPTNLWDTDNQEMKDFGAGSNGGYSEDDWTFYTRLRDAKPQDNPKRLALVAGQQGKFWNQNDNGENGDGIHILAPTADHVGEANECGDYNDCSYVLLYRTNSYRILFAGDSHDKTWEYILENHEDDVKNVELLIAPHHGRSSGRSFDFLDVLNPALTLFGNAKSEFLAYTAWSTRGLPKITNNQAGSILVDAGQTPMTVYVTCKNFALASNEFSFEHPSHSGFHYWGVIQR